MVSLGREWGLFSFNSQLIANNRKLCLNPLVTVGTPNAYLMTPEHKTCKLPW